MEKIERQKALNDRADKDAFLQGLLATTGDQVLNRILEHSNPKDLVQQIPQEDFYWMVKRVGEDECLPLLKMASDDQRQYLLDLEIWDKGLPDLGKASLWLSRLHMADPERASKWFFSEGEAFIYYYLFKNIRVETRYGDIDPDFEETPFSVDGVFYITIPEESHRQTIEAILRTMANVDFERYQYLISTLSGVIPAEMEEDMYRMRNVRLAEHGFLPPEEAMEVYSPLKPDSLIVEEHDRKTALTPAEELREIIPISPAFYAHGENILTKAYLGIDDNLFLDRFRLEFAGLCNQIMSADGALANQLDTLIGVCKKAGGHLNLALESLCGTEVFTAQKALKNNSLVSIFRVGFGLVLDLRWETERWRKNCWFNDQGLGIGFWGDQWAGTLSGILMPKPRLYTSLDGKDDYKDFEHLSELDECRKLVGRIKSLDRLLWRLTGLYPLEKDPTDQAGLTFHQMLFNLWARQLLNIKPCFARLSAKQVKKLFIRLRAGETSPPHRMPGFGDIFVMDFMSYASGFDPLISATLSEALSMIWKEFLAEYEWVSSMDLDSRFTKFIATEQKVNSL